MSFVYDALVIGGGINGLSACYHLARLGVRRLGLVERFHFGHDRGSSHSHSRITRSAYVNAHYVRLMQIAHKESWPQLERDAGEHLIYPTPGCFFGPPGGKYDRYAEAVKAVGVNVEAIAPDEARRRFPLFRFDDAEGVLHDFTAGLVAAEKTMCALVRVLRKQEVDLRDNTRVLDIDFSRSPIRVATERGTLEAERLVVTAGPWAAQLLPELKPRLTVARQTVGYFKLKGPSEQFQVGVFPVWGYLLDKGDVGYYGLPEFGQEGIKLARHIISGVDDDPDAVSSQTPQAALNDLQAFLQAQFVPPVVHCTGWETCLYTNTATEDFIIDRHPDHANIAIGAGFSGHGFKFGPLTGRILAELALNGKTSLPEFEQARHLFALSQETISSKGFA